MWAEWTLSFMTSGECPRRCHECVNTAMWSSGWWELVTRCHAVTSHDTECSLRVTTAWPPGAREKFPFLPILAEVSSRSSHTAAHFSWTSSETLLLGQLGPGTAASAALLAPSHMQLKVYRQKLNPKLLTTVRTQGIFGINYLLWCFCNIHLCMCMFHLAPCAMEASLW